MAAIVFLRLHNTLLSLRPVLYVEAHRSGDFRRPTYHSASR